MTNVLGLPNIGLQPDTWYSIQSYATDYYIGVGNSSAISQLSSVTDSSLWQFIPGSAPASYAVRSKTSEGRYCLNPGPELQLCDSIAAQYRVFNTAEDEAASVFVPSTDRQSAALYVQGESEEGDGVETKDLEGLGGKEGGLLFEVKSVAKVASGGDGTTLTTSTSQPAFLATASSSPSSSATEGCSNTNLAPSSSLTNTISPILRLRRQQ